MYRAVRIPCVYLELLLATTCQPCPRRAFWLNLTDAGAPLCTAGCQPCYATTSAAVPGLMTRGLGHGGFRQAGPLTELPLAESMICTLPMASHNWQHKLCICSQCYRSACLGQGCRPALLCRLVQFVADPAVSRSGLLLAVH